MKKLDVNIAKVKPDLDPVVPVTPERLEPPAKPAKEVKPAKDKAPERNSAGEKPLPQNKPARPAKPVRSLKGFYRQGVRFQCRFCGDPLGHFRFGRLIRNDDFQQALAILSTGQGYGFNGCKRCVTAELPLSEVQEAFAADPATPKGLRDAQVLEFKLVEIKEPGDLK